MKKIINTKTSLKKHRAEIDKKLIQKLKMFAVILLLMTATSIYEMLISDIKLLWILFGIILGITIGVIIGRMIHVEWHEEDNKVIGRLDVIGAIVLATYIAASMYRHWIFAHWFSGNMLTAFTLSFIEGIMIGRIISLRLNIKKVLIKQGKM